jgi:hypothetical protein
VGPPHRRRRLPSGGTMRSHYGVCLRRLSR